MATANYWARRSDPAWTAKIDEFREHVTGLVEMFDGEEVIETFTDLDDLIDIATSYVGREWVEHFPEFANRRPNPRRAS